MKFGTKNDFSEVGDLVDGFNVYNKPFERDGKN